MHSIDSIAAIAMHNGFSDSRSFSKAFAKRYGVQPNAYRKIEQMFAKIRKCGMIRNKKEERHGYYYGSI